MRTYSVIPAIAALHWFEMKWPASIEFDETIEHPQHARRNRKAKELRDAREKRAEHRRERKKVKEALKCQE